MKYITFITLGGRNSVAVKSLRYNRKDVGSNPAATRNENGHLEAPCTERCPNDPTGSKWETSDVKLN